MSNENTERDDVQHGIDDNPHGDAGKGALMGGLGGAAVGALAGGPVGAVIGAVAGALASGAGVAAVDAVDNDNTVSGIGDGVTRKDGDMTDTGYSTTERALNTTPMNTTDYATTTDYDTTVGGTSAAMNTDAMSTTATDGSTIRVPVMEEQLNVQKNMQQAGEVQVHKEVVTEQVNIPVEVSREEVVITRHAVNRDLAPGETTMGDEVLRIPVMEETVNVSKTAHVVEEIEIGKQRVTQQQNVSDTVRKEVVDIDDSTTDTRRNM